MSLQPEARQDVSFVLFIFPFSLLCIEADAEGNLVSEGQQECNGKLLELNLGDSFSFPVCPSCTGGHSILPELYFVHHREQFRRSSS